MDVLDVIGELDRRCDDLVDLLSVTVEGLDDVVDDVSQRFPFLFLFLLTLDASCGTVAMLNFTSS